MRILLAAFLMVVGMARAEMSSVQLFYVTSSTAKYHSTADFFDGNAKALRVMSVGGAWGATAYENPLSPLSKATAASATLLQATLIALQTSGTEYQDMNATLDLILDTVAHGSTIYGSVTVISGPSLTYHSFTSFTATHTGVWRDARNHKSVCVLVDMTTGGGRSATLYVTFSSSTTGTAPLDDTHGIQAGAAIVQTGIYTFEPCADYFKVRINASNGATVTADSTFRPF